MLGFGSVLVKWGTKVPRHRRVVFILSLACTLLAAGTVTNAHLPFYGVGTACRVVFKEDKILLTFDLSYNGFWAQGEMLAADTDRSSSVEEKEADAYGSKQWTEKIAPRIHVKFDGKALPIRKVSARHEGLVGEIYGIPFSLFYELEIDLPAGSSSGSHARIFEMEDNVVRDETPEGPRFLVPYDGHGSAHVRFEPLFIEPQPPVLDPVSRGYVLVGRRLVIKFSWVPVAGAPGPEADPRGETDGSRVQVNAEDSSDEFFENSVRNYRQLGWASIFGLILLATLYGAGHALAPGHGKSMVAAYLIGSQGRVRDAVILGVTTTLTHTGSVFLFGISLFLIVNAGTDASQGALKNNVIVGTKLLSGALLLIFGIFLFFRRLRGGEPEHHHGHHHHGHHHGHHHHPNHDVEADTDAQPGHKNEGNADDHHHHEAAADPHHGHEHGDKADDHHHHQDSHGLLRGGTPRLWELITLGFSGGIVPCPAGLTVILIGLHYPDQLLFTILLLVFFSIGLGAVLVAIGVLLITGKALARRRSQPGMLFQGIAALRKVFSASFLEALDRNGVRFLKVLPAFSGLFIGCLGAFFFVSTLLTGGTEVAAMLRSAADWLSAK